jgi:hypothetical protein
MDTDNPNEIASKRDPIYRALYAAIEDAVEANEPLLGSMYWKWAFPGYSAYAGDGKGEPGGALATGRRVQPSLSLLSSALAAAVP